MQLWGEQGSNRVPCGYGTWVPLWLRDPGTFEVTGPGYLCGYGTRVPLWLRDPGTFVVTGRPLSPMSYTAEHECSRITTDIFKIGAMRAAIQKFHDHYSDILLLVTYLGRVKTFCHF